MDTKIENIDAPSEEAAFHQGLALAELIGLFAFFLHETPEGQQAKKTLEQDWQATCQQLKTEKIIKGQTYSFSAWLKEIFQKLTPPSASSSRTHRSQVKKTHLRRPPIKFKNIH